MGLSAGVAAGHPATVEAGIEILECGGSAADAAVAASLASCVAETVMTGLLGGGHAIYWDAASGAARTLDCFVAVPGLGGERRRAELLRLQVPFGTELVHYAVGPASCGVPGLPAGLETLWRAHGRVPWATLTEPATRLATGGVVLPPAHAACLAMLAPVMTMNEGARIYASGGRLLEAGERLEQPGLAETMRCLAEEGAGAFYRGTVAERLLALMDARSGLVTRADLERYRPRWREPVAADYRGLRLLGRRGLLSPLPVLASLPSLRAAPPVERALALVDALASGVGGGHTTNITAVDRDGNACVLTTSLGLGSGDWVPGLDLHLNSMLGEADLLVRPLTAGERMESMMAPMLALDGDEPVLAAGAAGGTRLRSALVQVAAGVLDEGVAADEAVARPRLHPAAPLVHVEPGWPQEALAGLARSGLEVRAWPSTHHYFGGVSLISANGAAGDPRRDGAARTLA